VYSVASPGASGHGEGARLIGSIDRFTTDTGIVGFSVPVSRLDEGEWVTATATDSAGNTSEFSAAFQVPERGPDGPRGNLLEASPEATAIESLSADSIVLITSADETSSPLDDGEEDSDLDAVMLVNAVETDLRIKELDTSIMANREQLSEMEDAGGPDADAPDESLDEAAIDEVFGSLWSDIDVLNR
jgi:hypothetical protein